MLGTGTFWSPLQAANLPSQLDTKTQVGTDEWRNDLSDVVLDVAFPTEIVRWSRPFGVMGNGKILLKIMVFPWYFLAFFSLDVFNFFQIYIYICFICFHPRGTFGPVCSFNVQSVFTYIYYVFLSLLAAWWVSPDDVCVLWDSQDKSTCVSKVMTVYAPRRKQSALILNVTWLWP